MIKLNIQVGDTILMGRFKNKKVVIKTINYDDYEAVVDLPFRESYKGIFFDHHSSGKEFINIELTQCISYEKSCGRVIVKYFSDLTKGLPPYETIVNELDKIDSADYKINDLTYPSIYVKLSFLFNILKSEEVTNSFMRYIIEQLRYNNYTLKEDTQNLIHFMYSGLEKEFKVFNEELTNIVKYKNNILIIDNSLIKSKIKDQYGKDKLVSLGKIKPFLYWIAFKQIEDKYKIDVGVNIFRKEENKTNIGEYLKLNYSGGGHKNIGGCFIDSSKKDKVIEQIINQLESETRHCQK